MRSEFHHPEFEEYRDEFGYLVRNPNLDNHRENALRRALLFLRRGAMWRELPEDTQWFQSRTHPRRSDSDPVFPRAQWRRVAEGSFYMTDMIESLRQKWQETPDDEFFRKLDRITKSVHGSQVNPDSIVDRSGRPKPAHYS